MMMRSHATVLLFLAFFLMLSWNQLALITAHNSDWLTLDGKPPVVIARGGFSGLFPGSSTYAYGFVKSHSSDSTVLWCDVHLTKDGVGMCLPDLKLDNCTNIASIYPQGNKVYDVNGVNTKAWFVLDFTEDSLALVSLVQPIYSRIYNYDNYLSLLAVTDVVPYVLPSSKGLWLNIQYDRFYSEHNLSVRSYLLSLPKDVILGYISSPEVAFLKSIAQDYQNSTTKLIFRFLDKGLVEPTTNQTYASLLTNLTDIKSFASGILVPKKYIWPVTSDNYLLPSTSVVNDAHDAGLEIYAADLANDNLFSYNYSFDPMAECLSYIDNGAFSVDGLVSDFPVTPSGAIACYSHINKSIVEQGKPIIISNNGASGDYPDCTDLAYRKAVDDGADIIDCPVQVTEDLTLICMSNIDLIPGTTVTKSAYGARTSSIADIKPGGVGIFTFNLSWSEIQSLKPVISSPQSFYHLNRNPRNKNDGKFWTLPEFLAYSANRTTLAGVLIYIQNAAFLANRLNYDVIDAVIAALNEAGYDSHPTQQVMIESADSAVLVKFKQQSKFKLVYKINTTISGADAQSVADIKGFADAVAVKRDSIYPKTSAFVTAKTDVVSKFHNAGLEVYSYVFQNEFLSQPWDFLSDATMEINAHVEEASVDGIITQFPATARRYKDNSCNKLGDEKPSFLRSFIPGALLEMSAPMGLPPALPPSPVLNVSDVIEPPLPVTLSGTVPSTGFSNGTTAPPPQPSSGQLNVASVFVAVMIVFECYLLL